MAEDRTYSDLVVHPVKEINAFLDDFDLEEEWIGVVGGPQHDDGDIVLAYDVRTLDGPYAGKVGKRWKYRLTGDETLAASEIYREQAIVIEATFPDSTVQCYQEEHWDVDR